MLRFPITSVCHPAWCYIKFLLYQRCFDVVFLDKALHSGVKFSTDPTGPGRSKGNGIPWQERDGNVYDTT